MRNGKRFFFVILLLGRLLLLHLLEQEAHHLQMAPGAGQGEGGLPGLLGVGVDSCAVANEDLERREGYVKRNYQLKCIGIGTTNRIEPLTGEPLSGLDCSGRIVEAGRVI